MNVFHNCGVAHRYAIFLCSWDVDDTIWDERAHSGPGCWVLSQALLLLHYHLDNGGNVCGLEFNYDNPKEDEDEDQNANENDDDSNNCSNDQEDTISLLRGDLADSELLYNEQFFRQLFLGFEVETEKGR